MASLFAKGALLSALCALLAACDDASSRPQIDIDGKTMGTFYSVKVSGDVAIGKQELQRQIDAVLERANDDISTYRADSVLSQFNRSASLEPQPIPRGMADIVLMAQRIGRDTGGAMDITVGPLVNLWGFGPDKHPVKVPEQAQIDAAKQRIGLQHLKLISDNRGSGCKKICRTCMSISTLGEGYGADELVRLMNRNGITNYRYRSAARSLHGASTAGQTRRVAIQSRPTVKTRCRRWWICTVTASAPPAATATTLNKTASATPMSSIRPPAGRSTTDWFPPR